MFADAFSLCRVLTGSLSSLRPSPNHHSVSFSSNSRELLFRFDQGFPDSAVLTSAPAPSPHSESSPRYVSSPVRKARPRSLHVLACLFLEVSPPAFFLNVFLLRRSISHWPVSVSPPRRPSDQCVSFPCSDSKILFLLIAAAARDSRKIKFSFFLFAPFFEVPQGSLVASPQDYSFRRPGPSGFVSALSFSSFPIAVPSSVRRSFTRLGHCVVFPYFVSLSFPFYEPLPPVSGRIFVCVLLITSLCSPILPSSTLIFPIWPSPPAGRAITLLPKNSSCGPSTHGPCPFSFSFFSFLTCSSRKTGKQIFGFTSAASLTFVLTS